MITSTLGQFGHNLQKNRHLIFAAVQKNRRRGTQKGISREAPDFLSHRSS
jgi:hypothetical protein